MNIFSPALHCANYIHTHIYDEYETHLGTHIYMMGMKHI